MFISERLVFTELHKTGGSHIGKWLAHLVGGEQIGKHNRIPEALWSRFILGSVRNPWDWYVSLWAFGCGGQGGVHRRVTRRLDCAYATGSLGHEMGRRIPSPWVVTRQCWHDLRKPVRHWKETYRDPADALAFRRWLEMLMDPARRFDVAEGFGFSPVSDWAGLLTYRYLKLFSRLGDRLYTDKRLKTRQGASQLWHESRLVNFIVQNERLEHDLIAALELAGIPLDASQREALLGARNDRTNTSRRLPMAHYYDRESIELVRIREALIIEDHGYQPPGI